VGVWDIACDSTQTPQLPPTLLIDNLLPHGRSAIKHKFSCGRDLEGGRRGVERRRHIAACSQVGGSAGDDTDTISQLDMKVF